MLFQSEKNKMIGAEHIEKNINIERLLEITCCEKPYNERLFHEPINTSKKEIKISVARDAAFNFIYHENMVLFEKLGHLTFFSPLTDTEFPETDLLYLPGGVNN